MYKPKIENLPKETYKEDRSDILAAIYTLKKMSIRIHTVKKIKGREMGIVAGYPESFSCIVVFLTPIA